MSPLELWHKIQMARGEGLLWQKSKRRLLHYGGRPLIQPMQMSWEMWRRHRELSPGDRRLSVADGFADHRGRPEAVRAHPEVLKRIVAAYQAAKQAQLVAPRPFQVRGFWAGWIETNYGPLIHALRTEDLVVLARLFDNFNREQFTVGLGTGYENFVAYGRSPRRAQYVRAVWCDYRDRALSVGMQIQDAHFPPIGNPAGIHVGGDVIQIDTFRHIYHALEMREWLRGVPEPVVVEIGGGYGDQAYQLIKATGATVGKYVIFDLPEVAAISSFFLLTALPDLRIRLFGEGPVSLASRDPYDLGVFPHFAMSAIGAESVDLYHNSCSFAEMDAASSAEYLRIIERTCRRYFAHVNHELVLECPNEDGTMSVNIPGSRLVPDPTRFKRVYKKPRVMELPEDRCGGFTAFEYLYARLA